MKAATPGGKGGEQHQAELPVLTAKTREKGWAAGPRSRTDPRRSGQAERAAGCIRERELVALTGSRNVDKKRGWSELDLGENEKDTLVGVRGERTTKGGTGGHVLMSRLPPEPRACSLREEGAALSGFDGEMGGNCEGDFFASSGGANGDN
eukprot:266577-Rhodomonas_salina.1